MLICRKRWSGISPRLLRSVYPGNNTSSIQHANCPHCLYCSILNVKNGHKFFFGHTKNGRKRKKNKSRIKQKLPLLRLFDVTLLIIFWRLSMGEKRQCRLRPGTGRNCQCKAAHTTRRVTALAPAQCSAVRQTATVCATNTSRAVIVFLGLSQATSSPSRDHRTFWRLIQLDLESTQNPLSLWQHQPSSHRVCRIVTWTQKLAQEAPESSADLPSWIWKTLRMELQDVLKIHPD